MKPTGLKNVILVTDQGVPFFVKLVLKNEMLVCNAALTHDKEDPIVEFYDMRHKGFTLFGQFVSSHYASTLLKRKEAGLCLDGGVRAWDVDETAMTIVRRWLKVELG